MCSCSDAYILHPRKDLGRVGEGFAGGSVLIMGLSITDPSQNSPRLALGKASYFLAGCDDRVLAGHQHFLFVFVPTLSYDDTKKQHLILKDNGLMGIL